MKLKKLESASDGRNLCEICMHFKLYYFPTKKKTNSKKPSVGGTYAQIFKTVATLNFANNFFAKIVNIERWYRCKTYWCNKSRTTLIWLPDLVIVINLLFRSLLTLLKILGVLFFKRNVFDLFKICLGVDVCKMKYFNANF